MSREELLVELAELQAWDAAAASIIKDLHVVVVTESGRTTQRLADLGWKPKRSSIEGLRNLLDYISVQLAGAAWAYEAREKNDWRPRVSRAKPIMNDEVRNVEPLGRLAAPAETAGESGVAQASWMPIETAPKDKNVLVDDRGQVSEAYYNGETDTWWLANTSEHDFDHADAIYPTIWHPLPALPASSLPSTQSASAAEPK